MRYVYDINSRLDNTPIVESGVTGCMLNGRPVARGECISSRASGTPVTTSPALVLVLVR